MSASDRVLVAVPTYDERENIESVLARLRAAVPHAHVLVVDDGSPDGTGELADAVAATDDHVHVMHRTSKQGLGAAYVAAFEWGLDRGYEVLVEMDADGSHQPEQLPRLLEALAEQRADLVLGSRWVAGGAIVNWPWHRVLLSRGGSLYARTALGISVRDATGGFRAFRAEALARLLEVEVASQGYCFQIDMVRRAVAAGMRVREVPITFVERERGRSKMSRAIVVEAVRRVSVWGWQDRTARLRRAVPDRRPVTG